MCHDPGKIHEPARDVPVIHECDICVVGGSCTGLFAAVRAARLGARVAIIEQQNCFGGVATTGLVNVWHSLLDTEFRKPIIAGLSLEILERLQKRGALKWVSGSASVGSVFNSEELKIELDILAREAGLKVYLHTQFVAPYIAEGKLQAVIVENKSGRGAIRAAMVIDATGDGDVAARAGVPIYWADHLQPATACVRFSGWETLKGLDYGRAFLERGKEYGLPEGFVWKAEFPDSHVTMLAGTRIYGSNCTIADELTASEMEGRRQVRAISDLLKAAVPDSHLVLQALPARLGLRESRHIRCLYQLTGDDVLTGRHFEDAIANGSYRSDIHHQDKPGITLRYLDGHEEYCRPGFPTVQGRWRPESSANPTYYQIPFRSLVPGLYPNLIMAGRMLDAAPEAFGAVRVMVNLNQTGEAAGVAAWLALDSRKPIAEVDIRYLRRLLTDGGSICL